MDQLSIRLQMICDMIDKTKAASGRVIDVGSDHGLLALNCLTSKLTPFCICTDIHAKPAERTRQCLIDNNMGENSEVYCTNGLKGVDLKINDSVVMAGLGGLNIADIIEAAMEVTSVEIMKEVDFILQPQKSSDKLREFLCNRGFKIVDEEVTQDREYFYVGIKARYIGVKTEISVKDKFYGPVLQTKNSDLLDMYFMHLTDVYRVRSRGDEELRLLLEDIDV